MEDKTVKWDDIKRKIWIKNTWEKFKMKTKNVVKAAGNFVIQHPVESAAMIGSVVTIARKGNNAYQTYAEDKRRKCDYYDTRTGKHSHIKRKLNPREQMIVDERWHNGESYTAIFYDMGLLK